MKKNIELILILTSLMSLSACDPTSKWKSDNGNINKASQQSNLSAYAKKIERFRDSANTMFVSGANGILPKSDIPANNALKFYPTNEAYRVAATFEHIVNGEVLKMKTSTDRLPEYKRYGTLTFMLLDSTYVLTLYQNVEQPEYLFCPFKDATNGKVTYGAGRYLDFTLSDLKAPVVDFNVSYNPYCAYNPQYSCPIPPYENHLNVAIPAGEKKWH
jgi:uncharacterized protein (DUF1684 family)